MSLAILLSGQGGQHPEMFDLTRDVAPAQEMFSCAKNLLGGVDPRDLVGSGADLHGNRTGQILCCVAALAGWALIAPHAPRAIVAGYSVGDLAAWGVAGRLAPEAVLRLAAARAEAMDAAAAGGGARGGFGLAGIRGLRRPALADLAARHGCDLAIRNAEDSAVLGGPRDALDGLCREATGMGAQRAVVLAVHTPSHTPRLAAATGRFRDGLAAETLHRPPPGAPRLVSGLDGAPVFAAGAGLDKLARQIAQEIDWAACLAACREWGAEAVIELGPGHALATMARDAMPDARVHALDDFRGAEGLTRWIRSGA